MRRKFFRPFFDFHDPFFFPRVFEPSIKFTTRRIPIARVEDVKALKSNDPHDVFEKFFDEHGINQKEKDFFKKHYPEKVQQQFDPYKTLQISKEATQDQIKEAYRNLALKYHPKNNSAPDAANKFAEVAKAYQELMIMKSQNRYEDFGFKSFFQDFDKQLGQIFKQGKQKQNKVQGEKSKQSPYGELYSQSSHAQSVNGKQTKFVVQKTYKKDGKILSVKREQKLKDDGQTEITQIIDDGKEVKKKQYIQGKENTKKLE